MEAPHWPRLLLGLKIYVALDPRSFLLLSPGWSSQLNSGGTSLGAAHSQPEAWGCAEEVRGALACFRADSTPLACRGLFPLGAPSSPIVASYPPIGLGVD